MSNVTQLVEADGRTPVRAQVLDPLGQLWTGRLIMRPGGMVVFAADSPEPVQVESVADVPADVLPAGVAGATVAAGGITDVPAEPQPKRRTAAAR